MREGSKEYRMLVQMHGMLSVQLPWKPEQMHDIFRNLEESGITVKVIAEGVGREEQLVSCWVEGHDLPEAAEWPELIQRVLLMIEYALGFTRNKVTGELVERTKLN